MVWMLIYDGGCGFCTASADWITVPAVPWQRLDREELERLGLSVDDVGRTAWWIDARGRTFRGHLAIAHALAAGRGWRSIVGKVLLVAPFRWAGAAVYPLVARWRRFLPS
jgi:predicted DCC family thiol-disulfide oxidoreductase YuxK